MIQKPLPRPLSDVTASPGYTLTCHGPQITALIINGVTGVEKPPGLMFSPTSLQCENIPIDQNY